MSEILGYDCDGRPVRAGDRIEVTAGPERKPECVGVRGTITRVEPYEEVFVLLGKKAPILEYREDSGRLRCGHDRTFRKLPPIETGDWSEIHRQTGWEPGRIHEEA